MWKKIKSGLQFWGSDRKLRETHRAQCPHTQFVRGNYSLWISDVRADDGGEYICTVEGEESTVVMLRVIKGTKNLLNNKSSRRIFIP